MQSRALNPDVTLGACGCPVLPGRAAELVRIAHVYENLVPAFKPAFANKLSSKQRLARLTVTRSLPGPARRAAGGRRPGAGRGRGAGARTRHVAFSFLVTRQFA